MHISQVAIDERYRDIERDEGSGLMELGKFTAPAAIHLKHLLDEAANKMVLKAKDLRDRAEIEADNKNGDPRYKNHFLSQERDARKTAELFSELSKAALTQAYIAMKNEDATK